MAKRRRNDKAWLLATAKAVAIELKRHSPGTRLRIRMPTRATTTNTDGWAVVIGDLGKNQPRLEIWFDRFSGYPERKLYACFRSKVRPPLIAITKPVARKLWPIRLVTSKDTSQGKFLALANRLGSSEFNVPILEKYWDGGTFNGIYDPTRETAQTVSRTVLYARRGIFCGRGSRAATGQYGRRTA